MEPYIYHLQLHFSSTKQKMISMIYKVQLLLLVMIVIASCGKSTQECAEESLIGDWKVNRVMGSETTLADGNPLQQVLFDYEDIDGHFTFTTNMMDYEYTTNSIMMSNQEYTLEVTKENSGFTRVDVFTIKGDIEDFRVRFGDQTSDAHENASEITLEQSISTDTLLVDLYIELVRE